MAIFIDGYNLLHVTGLFGRGIGPGTLERSRGALLNFLATALEQRDLSQTTIVFDAKDAPPGLPRQVDYQGITVLYAAGYEDADTLLEEMISKHSAPRQLVVVSSDHRVQRAARRRRATAVDSGPWYAELVRQQRSTHSAIKVADGKPAAPLSREEVQWWLREFGDVELEKEAQPLQDKAAMEEGQGSDSPDDLPDDLPENEQPLKPEEDYGDLGNPFPPGYGEDLLDGDV